MQNEKSSSMTKGAVKFNLDAKFLAEQKHDTHVILSQYLRESHTFSLYASVLQGKTDAKFYPFECDPSDTTRFHSLFESLALSKSLKSVMVSDPFKVVTADLCASLTNRAKLARSVNLVTSTENGELLGDNLDGMAFWKGIVELDNLSISNRSVAFFGCGGVTSAVSTLTPGRFSKIGLIDVSPERATRLRETLMKDLGYADVSILPPSSERNLAPFHILYNGTGLGKKPFLNTSPLLATDDISNCTNLIDAIYTPSVTPFLNAGNSLGIQITNGLSHMLASTSLHCSLIAKTEINIADVENAYLELQRIDRK
jgi:shikimate 5-dehydrogenase